MKRILIAVMALTLAGCENLTPEQISAISSVVTTTGQVVIPALLTLENGRTIKVKPKKKPKPTPTPNPAATPWPKPSPRPAATPPKRPTQ